MRAHPGGAIGGLDIKLGARHDDEAAVRRARGRASIRTRSPAEVVLKLHAVHQRIDGASYAVMGGGDSAGEARHTAAQAGYQSRPEVRDPAAAPDEARAHHGRTADVAAAILQAHRRHGGAAASLPQRLVLAELISELIMVRAHTVLQEELLSLHLRRCGRAPATGAGAATLGQQRSPQAAYERLVGAAAKGEKEGVQRDQRQRDEGGPGDGCGEPFHSRLEKRLLGVEPRLRPMTEVDQSVASPARHRRAEMGPRVHVQ